MAKLKDKNLEAENLLLELAKLLPVASQTLVTIVGLSGFAYIIGWFYVDSYFSTFNAGWLGSELSAGSIISKSFWPLATIFVFLWLGLLKTKKAPENNVAISNIHKYMWMPLIGIELMKLFLWYKVNVIWAGALSKIFGLILAIWVASGIHSLIIKSKNKTLGWNFSTGAHIVLIVVGLFFIPKKYGEAKALQDLSSERSNLPRIKPKQESDHQADLRLLLNFDDRYYAVEFSDSTKLWPNIRLMKFEDIQTIQIPTRK